MVSGTENGIERYTCGGDEIMGMESFFVTLLPRDMEFCYQDNIRIICGKSDVFEVDWEAILGTRDYSISKKESCIILNDCLELQIIRNREDSPYIVLSGCFSCFSESVKEMCSIIDFISKVVNKDFRIDVLGNTHELIESVGSIIYDAYRKKHDAFKYTFGNVKLLAPPSRFYKDYKKMKNPFYKIIRILKKE